MHIYILKNIFLVECKYSEVLVKIVKQLDNITHVLNDESDNAQISIPIDKYEQFIALIKEQRTTYYIIKPIIKLSITNYGVRLYTPFKLCLCYLKVMDEMINIIDDRVVLDDLQKLAVIILLYEGERKVGCVNGYWLFSNDYYK